MNRIMAWNSRVVMYPIRERLLRNESTDRGRDVSQEDTRYICMRTKKVGGMYRTASQTGKLMKLHISYVLKKEKGRVYYYTT